MDREFEYLTEPLDENEDVLGVFYGTARQWGAQFVVTNRRLLAGPLDVGLADDILLYLMGKAGGPTELVKAVLKRYSAAKTVWLRHVVDIQATHSGGWLRAPGLQVRTNTNQVLRWNIVHEPKALSRDHRNVEARDQAVAVIERAVASAQAASR